MLQLRFTFRLALPLFVFLIASCATVDKNRVDPVGRGPFPEDYEIQLKAHMMARLIDPKSLIVNRIEMPKKGIIKVKPVGRTFMNMDYNDEVWYGHANFNAKNKLGGYAGNTEYVYWFKKGMIALCESEESFAYYYRVEPVEE